MKTFFFLLALCLSALSATAQTSSSFRKTSDTTWWWHNNQWVMFATKVYDYKPNEVITSYAQQNKIFSKEELLFDGDKRVIRFKSFFKDSDRWNFQSNDTLEYFLKNGNVEVQLRYFRDSLGSVSPTHDSTYFAYDAQGREIDKWEYMDSASVKFFFRRYTKDYDGQGRLYRMYDFYIPEISAFRTTCFYDAGGKLISAIGESRGDPDTSRWAYPSGTSYSYNADGLLEKTFKLIWSSNKFDTVLYTRYEYDKSNNLVTYYENAIEGKESKNSFKITSGYTEISGVVESENQTTFFSRLSPNPASEEAEVEFSLPKDDFVAIEIRDILGNTILQTEAKHFPAGENREKIGIKPLLQGVYFCTIRTSGCTETRRLLILK